MDFPNREHQGGSFLRISAVCGVCLSTSVLSFSKTGSTSDPSLVLVWEELFLCQKRVKLNLVGAFFPPENWMVCQPSVLLLSPSETNSSESSASCPGKQKCRKRICETKSVVL